MGYLCGGEGENRMIFTGITPSGKKIFLGSPLAFELQMSFDVPADSLDLTVPCESPLPELAKIEVLKSGKIIFRGIVDEQETKYSSTGCKTAVSARSMTAVLLDNEAVPAVYNQPSLNDIFSLHAAPYGFAGFVGNGRCLGKFTVSKGMSEWEVIETFCKSVCGVQPRVSPDMYIYAQQLLSGGRITVSNTADGAVRFMSSKLKLKRYGIISSVCYKPDNKSGYVYTARNADAEEREICCKRLLNLANSQSWFNQYAIESKLKDSLKGSFEIQTAVSDDVDADIGSSVDFEDSRLGRYSGLRVHDIAYVLDNNGSRQLLTLRPAEHF